MKKTTRTLVRVAFFAALYATLTLVLPALSYGIIQFRISESLVLLPLLFPESIWGLTIGCFIANIPMGLMDMVLGSLATLLACIFSRLLKKPYFAIFPPIVFNALIIPIIFLSVPDITTPYLYNVMTISLSELVAMLSLSLPLYYGVKSILKKKGMLSK